jgi:hypothetical protein
MADHHHTNGPCQMSPSSHMEQQDASNRNSDPKKRKRKRLLAVLDKLHNNNTNTNTAQDAAASNNNSILVNNNNILATNNDPKSYSTNLARSMQENAEILRNLFALSRSLPTHPAFPSPFAAAMQSQQSPNYECNNNAPSPDHMKMMLNGKVKMEVKEEVMDEEDNCSASVLDSKAPLHDFLQLPKTTFNNQPLSPFGHQQFYHHQNGFFGNHHQQVQQQDAPLDLSMKTFKRRQSSSSAGSPSLTKQLLMQQTEQKLNAVLHPLGIQVPRDCSISLQTTPNSASSSPHQLPQYYHDLKVSPIVEEVAPGSNHVAYVCPICGQMFSLNDRLAKHIASRHKTKSPASESTKSYVCEVCDRSFAR